MSSRPIPAGRTGRVLALLAALAAAPLLPGAARAQEPAPPLPVPPAPEAPAAGDSAALAPLDALLGGYEAAPGRILTILAEDDTLYGETGTGDRKKLIHQSGTTYAAEGTGMTLTFTLGADGRATAVVLRQGGNERTLPRVR
jgi:hypothetical protein